LLDEKYYGTISLYLAHPYERNSMSSFVVWLDSDHAHIHKFTTDGVNQENLKRHEKDHHTHNRGDVSKNSETFFHELATKLKDAERILLIGPGLGKTHFKSHLESHHHGKLSEKVIGVETVDHLTDNQIDAYARKYFHKQIFDHRG
jgi:stalled ribosome rescue protein Dom34